MWCFSEWSAYHWFISGYPSRVGDQVNIPLPVPVKIELKIGDDGVRALTDFAERTGSAVAGYCASALDMIIPQRRRWAFNNYARLVDHYDEENHKRKEAGKRPIAPRFAHPAFQVIGDEDDSDMLALWARLLASLQDGASGIKENRAFIGMLQQMEPIDAKVLKWLCDAQRDSEDRPYVQIMADDAGQVLGIDRGDLLLSMHNLSRIGGVNTVGLIDMSQILAVTAPAHKGYLAGPPILIFDTMYFRLTTLGICLIDSCRSADDPATNSTEFKFE